MKENFSLRPKYLVMLQLPTDHFVLHPFYQLPVLAGTPSKISPEFGKNARAIAKIQIDACNCWYSDQRAYPLVY